MLQYPERIAVALTWIVWMWQIKISLSSSAPWQSRGNTIVEESNFGGLPPTVFAPGGRLYSVERVLGRTAAAEDKSSILAVALHCRDGTVLVSTSSVSPHLYTNATTNNNNNSLTTSLWLQDDDDDDDNDTGDGELSSDSNWPDHSFVFTGGNAADSLLLRRRIERVAEYMMEENDGGQNVPSATINSAFLARRVADSLQETTQTQGQLLASSAIIVGERINTINKRREGGKQEFPFCIWRIDPTGQFWDCNGAAIGRGSKLAESYLLKFVLKNKIDKEAAASASYSISNEKLQLCLQELSTDQALSVACKCIVEALKLQPNDDQWKQMQGTVWKVNDNGKKRKPWTVHVKTGKELFRTFSETKLTE